MALINAKTGDYGVLEVNKLTSRVTGNILAQYALDADIDLIENGMFLGADHVARELILPTVGEYGERAYPWLHFTTEKEYNQFVRGLNKVNPTPSATNQFYPRCYKVEIGDVFTTDTFKVDDALAPLSNEVFDAGAVDYDAIQDLLDAGRKIYGIIGVDGYIQLVDADDATNFDPVDHYVVLQATAVTTLPDGVSEGIRFVVVHETGILLSNAV